MSADALLEQLRARRTQMAFVVDEFGGLTGMVTISDVLADLLGPLDGQRSARRPERLADGRFRIPGHVRLDALADAVGWTWEGEADTVGGLVTERLGRLPARGDRLLIDGRPVEVEAATPRTVLSVVVGPAHGESTTHG
jgi:CBS domain containing-hemolysin-like protein